MKSLRLGSFESDTGGRDVSYPRELGVGAGNTSWLGKSMRSQMTIRKTGRIESIVPYPAKYAGVYCTKFSPDGDSFVAAFGAGVVKVYRRDGQCMQVIKPYSPEAPPVMYAMFHPRNQYVVFCADVSGYIHMCKLKERKVYVFSKEHKNEINTFDIDYTSTYLISGGKDANLRIYDLETGKIIQKYVRSNDAEKAKTGNHYQRIFKIKFHGNEEGMFFTGGWDNCVKVWDIRTKRGCILNIQGPQVYGDAIDVRERIVLTGSWKVSESLQTWDLRTGTLLDTVVAMNRKKTIDGEFVYCAQFYHNDEAGDIIISGTSGVEMLEIISIEEKKVICNFKVQKVIYTVDSFEERIVFGGMENNIKIAEYAFNQ